MNVNELIGKRCLFKKDTGFGRSDVDEFKIIEVSPTGSWTKLMNIHGRKFWKATTNIALVEVLKQLDSPPKEK